MKNSIVTKIDYSDDSRIVLDITNEQAATKSIIGCSILLVATGATVLQPGNDDAIVFEPSLADDYPQYLAAFQNIDLSKGYRAFLEFSTGDFFDGKDIIYIGPFEFTNAVLDQPSTRHILTIEQIDDMPDAFVDMSDEGIRDALLESLDLAFPDHQPSTLLEDWRVQNWSQERFIRGRYNVGIPEAYLRLAKSLVDDSFFILLFGTDCFSLFFYDFIPCSVPPR